MRERRAVRGAITGGPAPVADRAPSTGAGPVRHALGAALQVDRSLVSPVAGLVTVVPLAVLFGLGLAFWSPAVTSGLALGAWFVGMAARLTLPRPAASTLVLDTAGLALSALVGAGCSSVGWLHLSTLVVWCFGGGLAVALGPGRSVVGTQAVLAMVVFGRSPQTWHEAVVLAAAVAGGGAAQTLVQLLVRAPVALRPQRQATAAAYRALATLAGSVGTGSPRGSSAVAAAVDAALDTLRSTDLFGRPDVQALRGLADQARRMRLELLALDGLVRGLPTGDGGGPTMDAVFRGTRRLLRSLAGVLAGGTGRDELSGAAAELARAVDELGREAESPSGPDREVADREVADREVADHLVGHVRSLSGQLRAADRLVDQATDVRLGSVLRLAVPHVSPLRAEARAAGDVVAASLTRRSPAFRHAVRLAVVVPVLDLVFSHWGLERSYWVPLSAAVVLRPDYTATLARGVSRLGGTVLGVGALGVVVALAHPGPVATTVLVTVLGWAAFTLIPANYGVGVVFLTGVILLLVDVGRADTLGLAGYRLADSLLGGAVALVAYLVWPTWSRDEAGRALGRLADAQRRYAGAVLAGFTPGGRRDAEDLRSLGRAARLAYGTAEAVVARSLSEPAAHRMDPDVGRGTLAGLRRAVQAVHRLRLEVPGNGDGPAGPGPRALSGWSPLADAVDDAYRRVAGALVVPAGPGRAGAASATPGPEAGAAPVLRPFLQRLGRDEGAAVPLPVGLALDELVNALDTVGELVDSTGPARP